MNLLHGKTVVNITLIISSYLLHRFLYVLIILDVVELLFWLVWRKNDLYPRDDKGRVCQNITVCPKSRVHLDKTSWTLYLASSVDSFKKQ